MAVAIELHLIDLAFAPLRIADRGRQARLLAAISRDGQQQPVLVVARDDRYVLIDGYRRLAAVKKLGFDLVQAVILPLCEADALAYAHRNEANRRRSAIEDAWLLRELIETFELRQQDLARFLQRSASWVSRRLALARQLPETVQKAVRDGRIGAHAAEKYLVPLARANRGHAERLAKNLHDFRPTDRQMGRLCVAWRSAVAEVRERIVDHPALYLKTDEESPVKPAPDEPASTVVHAIEAISGTCGRARKVAREGALHRLDAVGRAAVGRAFEEATLAFRSLRSLLSQEGLDARRGDAVGSPGTIEEGPQRTSDRESAADLAGIDE